MVGQPNKFDVELLGDCDAIVMELTRRLGWALPVEEAVHGGKVGGWEDGKAACEFEGPNRYYFVNAKRPVREGEEEESEGEEEEEEEVEEEEEEEAAHHHHRHNQEETMARAAEREVGEMLRPKKEEEEEGRRAGRREEKEVEEEEEEEVEGGRERDIMTVASAPHHMLMAQASPLFPPQSPALMLDVPAFNPPALLSPIGSPFLSGTAARGTKDASKPSSSSSSSTYPMSPRSNTNTPRAGMLKEDSEGGSLAELDSEEFYLP